MTGIGFKKEKEDGEDEITKPGTPLPLRVSSNDNESMKRRQSENSVASSTVPLSSMLDLMTIAHEMETDLKHKGLIKDRKYHLRAYRKCFLHQDGLRWLVDKVLVMEQSNQSLAQVGGTDLRSESASVCSSFTSMENYLDELKLKAARLGNLMIKAGYLSHVCDDHHFNVNHGNRLLFFRFHMETSTRNPSLDVNSRRLSEMNEAAASLQSLRNNENGDTRSVRLLLRQAALTESETSSLPESIPEAPQQQQSVHRPREVQTPQKDPPKPAEPSTCSPIAEVVDTSSPIAEGATGSPAAEVDTSHPIAEIDASYPIAEVDTNNPSDAVSVMTMQTGVSNSSTSTSKSSNCFINDPNRVVDVALFSIVRDFHSDFRFLRKIKDRTFHLKNYKKCFLHSDGMEWLSRQVKIHFHAQKENRLKVGGESSSQGSACSLPEVLTQEQAEEIGASIGNLMIHNGYVTHVCGNHVFLPNLKMMLFFKFREKLLDVDYQKSQVGRYSETKIGEMQQTLFEREIKNFLKVTSRYSSVK